MKKTYMIPTIKVVKIQPSQILAGSELGKGGNYNGGPIQARRSRFSKWEDDFDFEE